MIVLREKKYSAKISRGGNALESAVCKHARFGVLAAAEREGGWKKQYQLTFSLLGENIDSKNDSACNLHPVGCPILLCNGSGS